MGANEISFSVVWAWASSSSLLSTMVTLAVGSWILYKWQSRRAFEYEVVKFVSDEITAYANDAVQYWGSFADNTLNRHIAQQKIRNGFPVLFELIDNTVILDSSCKNTVHDALGNLYDAATGGSFESDEVKQKCESANRIESILFAAAVSRRVLFLAAIKK